MLDGQPTPPNFRLISGYVVQDDVVMGTLTVRENLMFSANLRLPPSYSKYDKTRKVDSIIKQLGENNLLLPPNVYCANPNLSKSPCKLTSCY